MMRRRGLAALICLTDLGIQNPTLDNRQGFAIMQ